MNAMLWLTQVCEVIQLLIKQKSHLFCFALSGRIPVLEGKLKHLSFWHYTPSCERFCGEEGKSGS